MPKRLEVEVTGYIARLIGDALMEFTIKDVENGYIVERKVNDEIKVFAFSGDSACADMLRFLLSEYKPQTLIRIEDENDCWSESIG
jgi:hypothetical protein